MDITRQAVTKHLKLLEAANLVVAIWWGREKLHYLNPVPIHEIDRPDSKLIEVLSGGWPILLASLKSLLETGEPLEETRHWPEGI